MRTVVDGSGNVKETRDYYPFGLPMDGRYDEGSPPTREDFTGHEKDAATGLHYAGARYYMSAFGRWNATDPMADEYPSLSPYNYVVNSPVNAVDPDGKLVIFVNGFRFGDVTWWKPWTWNNLGRGPCCDDYWKSFDEQIMRMMPEEEEHRYYDGSKGGFSAAFGRQMAGWVAAEQDFGTIMNLLEAERKAGLDGTIKIFSHSMGGAFANGLIRGLFNEAANRGVEKLRIAFHAAIDPWQAASFRAHPQVERTFQIRSLGSLADEKLEGAIPIPAREVSPKNNPGHDLGDYSPAEIMKRITGMSMSNELSSFILRAQRAGAEVTVVR